jgi:ABC-type uncharacterized transport system permease subunit
MSHDTTKAETGRMHTVLQRLYSHVMNVDIYRATRPSKALCIILLLLYLGLFTFLSCFLFSVFSLLPFYEHRDTISIPRHFMRDLLRPNGVVTGFCTSTFLSARQLFPTATY